MSENLMEYEAQFFGFTPQTFVLRLYLAFQDHLSHIMLVAEEAILKKLQGVPCDITPSALRSCTVQFFSFMKERFEKVFGPVEETVLNTVFCLPRNVLLPEHQFQEKFCYSAEQFQELQDEIRRREERLRVEAHAERALQAELEEQKAVQARLEKILQLFDTLDKVGRDEGSGNLKESFAAVMKTAAKLQNVVQEVEQNRLGKL